MLSKEINLEKLVDEQAKASSKFLKFSNIFYLNRFCKLNKLKRNIKPQTVFVLKLVY